MMEQGIGGLGPLHPGFPQFRSLGEESSITAGMLQQSYLGASVSFQNQPQMFGEEVGGQVSRPLRPEHRSSMPAGFQPPGRHYEQGRMVRSQSFPSNLSISPSTDPPARRLGNTPIEIRGSAGLDTPLTPATMQSPRPQNSPYSALNSIMKLPNMVPTPPQHGDPITEDSPRQGTTSTRPKSAPPPQFPNDDQFQALEEDGRRRKRGKSKRRDRDPPDHEDEVGEIRLCEEMAAEINEQQCQSRRGSSVLHSSFEALDSTIGDEGVDFLSNLKFEHHQQGEEEHEPEDD